MEEAGRYAAEDADVTLQLHLKMWPELQQHKGPLNVFENIDMPLVPVLSRVERNGVKIDPAVLHKHSEELTLRLNELEQKRTRSPEKRLTSLPPSNCKPSCLKSRVLSR